MNTDVLADPQYALARNGDTWSLTFAGLPAEFRHEKGADYAIYLLLHPPPSPMHALILIALCTRPLDSHGVKTRVCFDSSKARTLTLCHS